MRPLPRARHTDLKNCPNVGGPMPVPSQLVNKTLATIRHP